MATNSAVPQARTLGLLGAISGAVAWAAIDGARHAGLRMEVGMAFLQFTPLTLAPGLVFGLFIGGHFMARGRLGSGRLLAYWLASGLAYLSAYHIAYHLVDRWPFDGLGGMIAAGVVAGLSGSVLLALLSMPLLRVTAASVLRSVAVGAVAGALLPLISMDAVGGVSVGALAFFVLWQGAYAASLAPVMGAHSDDGGGQR